MWVNETFTYPKAYSKYVGGVKFLFSFSARHPLMRLKRAGTKVYVGHIFDLHADHENDCQTGTGLFGFTVQTTLLSSSPTIDTEMWVISMIVNSIEKEIQIYFCSNHSLMPDRVPQTLFCDTEIGPFCKKLSKSLQTGAIIWPPPLNHWNNASNHLPVGKKVQKLGEWFGRLQVQWLTHPIP